MHRLYHNEKGFTLIELMITVAVVGIIAGIAYPAYTSHLVRAKRSAAQSFMFNVANKQEQAMLNARSYFTVSTGATSEWTAVNVTVPTDVSAFYTMTVTSSTTPAYTITATPTGRQATNDAKCGTLTLTQTGAKGKSGSASASECWR